MEYSFDVSIAKKYGVGEAIMTKKINMKVNGITIKLLEIEIETRNGMLTNTCSMDGCLHCGFNDEFESGFFCELFRQKIHSNLERCAQCILLFDSDINEIEKE